MARAVRRLDDERAPGKVNLSLFVGAPRADGLHPLVSVVQAVTLADELTMSPRDATRSSASGWTARTSRPRARAFRAATGWDGPPQRITIVKRDPGRGGMGGGSADAAAVLRLAARAAGGAADAVLHEVAVALGADVPSLLRPGRVLMTGAGEHVDRLPDPEPFGLLIVPSRRRALHAGGLPRVRPAGRRPVAGRAARAQARALARRALAGQ